MRITRKYNLCEPSNVHSSGFQIIFQLSTKKIKLDAHFRNLRILQHNIWRAGPQSKHWSNSPSPSAQPRPNQAWKSSTRFGLLCLRFYFRKGGQIVTITNAVSACVLTHSYRSGIWIRHEAFREVYGAKICSSSRKYWHISVLSVNA